MTLTAPGEGIITASYRDRLHHSEQHGAASAEVAGMAALIRARYPGLTPRQVSQALTEGARFGRRRAIRTVPGTEPLTRSRR